MFYLNFFPASWLRSAARTAQSSHAKLLQTCTGGYCYDKQQLKWVPGVPAREKPPLGDAHTQRQLSGPFFPRETPSSPIARLGGQAGTADLQLGRSPIPPAIPTAIRSRLSFPAQPLHPLYSASKFS